MYATISAALVLAATPGGPVLNAQAADGATPASAPESTSGAQPWRSALYPENWKPGFADAEGRFLHDFSYAGYHRGELPLPAPGVQPAPGAYTPYRIEVTIIDVTQAPYSADRTGATDATEAIQKALDAAAQIKDGAIVHMPAGTYKIAPPEGKDVALRLTGDRVLLRGEGTGRTFLFTEAVQVRGKRLIEVRPANAAEWGAEKPPIPASSLTADLPNQAEIVPVADASPFSVGDLVIIRSDLTQRFIDELKMTGKWQPAGSMSPNRTLMFCRRITGVDVAGKTLKIDAPTRYPMKTADLARVVKIPGRIITESGLEDFSIGMKAHPGMGFDEADYDKQGTAGYDVHGATVIVFSFAENCWMRRVNSYGPAGNPDNVHIVSNGVRLSRSRYVTVTDCDWKHTQYKGGGGNGYLYTLHGQENLIVNCKAEDGRHNYSFGTMFSSGNVISRFYSKDGKLASDFHMFLSMSNLLDDITCEGDFLEARYYRPWGGNPIHGLTTTQSVFWNTAGLRYSKEKAVLVLSHQHGNGYVIGTRGPDCRVDSSNFVEGVGLGDGLVPQSLYADQLARRLKRESDARKGQAKSSNGTGPAASSLPAS